MAKKKESPKISKEDLKDDKVLEWTDAAMFWIRSNSTLILSVVVGIFLIFGITELTKNRREATLRQATDKLFEAITLFDNTLIEHPWGTPERGQGMSQVRDKADVVIAEFGGSASARNALFLKANAFYFEGDTIGNPTNTDRAIELFQLYSDEVRARGDRFELAAALHALAFANENRWLLTFGDDAAAGAAIQAALDYYSQVRDINEAGFLRYEAMLGEARIRAFLGEEDRAREIYKTVLTERFDPLPELEENPTQRDMMMWQLRSTARQFTTDNTARIQLRRLGVDVEALEEEITAGRT
ncbi:MAG: hypothetical protein JJU11_14310 [Candidatus Sumerlaeia bacterium]|nr:hypothetical protein [Candidatus Sumerlaeia bacterium]